MSASLPSKPRRRVGSRCAVFLPTLLLAQLLCPLVPGIAQVAAKVADVPQPEKANAVTKPGFDLSLDALWQHDSYTGWSDVLIPAVSYRFNRHVTVEASIPVFLKANTYMTTTAGEDEDETTTLETGHNLLGDTELAAKLEASRRRFSYQLTGIVGFATGNTAYALTANTTTFNITHHLEYRLAPFTPYIDLGEGNNSSLAEPAIRKDYTAVGQIANFQAGVATDLPFNLNLDLVAFEDLPIGHQRIYGTVSGGTEATAEEEKIVAEDNGVAAALEVPVGGHFTVRGSYERSFIQHLDIATAAVRWTFRPAR